jgi:hypothetical protein
MGMVREEGPGVDDEPGGCNQASEAGEKVRAIRLIPKDGTPFETPHHHMVEDPLSI